MSAQQWDLLLMMPWEIRLIQTCPEFSGQDVQSAAFQSFHSYGFGFGEPGYDIWESYRADTGSYGQATMDILTGERHWKVRQLFDQSSPNPFTDNPGSEYITEEAGSQTKLTFIISPKNDKKPEASLQLDKENFSNLGRKRFAAATRFLQASMFVP